MSMRLLKNDYSLNIVNKVYTIFVGLVTSSILTRYLGIAYRGDYSYILQVVTIMSLFLNLGMNQSYSYFYRKNNGVVLERFVNFYMFQFMINIIICISLGTIFKQTIYIYALILIPFNLVIQQLESTVAVENIKLKILMHMFNVTIKLIAFLAMYFFTTRSMWQPILITIILNLLTILVYIKKLNVSLSIFRVDFNFIKNVVEYSWLPMITSILLMLNYSVDILFLKHLGTNTELSLYSVAVGIINYFWMIPDSFKEVLLSRVSRQNSDNSILIILKISIISICFIIFSFILFGKFGINLLYGNEFVDAYLVTIILSVGSVSMVYFKILGVLFLAEGKRWVYFFSLFFSVILNVILNFLVIPLYGMYGAAVSSIISYTISGGICLIYYIKNKNLTLKETLVFSVSEKTMIKNLFKKDKKE